MKKKKNDFDGGISQEEVDALLSGKIPEPSPPRIINEDVFPPNKNVQAPKSIMVSEGGGIVKKEYVPFHFHKWSKWETISREQVGYSYIKTQIIQQRKCIICDKIQIDNRTI